MAHSDDERWPDPTNYPIGENIDHLEQLRRMRTHSGKHKQDERVDMTNDEHSTFQTLNVNVEELQSHVKEEKKKKEKEDEIRHHAWE